MAESINTAMFLSFSLSNALTWTVTDDIGVGRTVTINPSGTNWYRMRCAPAAGAGTSDSDTLDFKDDEHALTVWNGQYLYPWHARSNVSPLDAKRDPVAYFTFHQGKWFLVNQSNADMLLVDQPDYLRHGHATEITPGLRLLLSLEEGGRLAVFDFLSP